MMIEKTIEYIEKNLFNDISYDEIARITYTNKFNVMRVFSAVTDFTLAEYVRARRLSESGRLLAETDKKIIDIAFDCGYATPESFTKAFEKFNGFSPSDCRKTQRYKVVPKWKCGERVVNMNYEITVFDNFPLIGYGKRFSGKAENRNVQDEELFVSTRNEQNTLFSYRDKKDVDWWEILYDFNDEGFSLEIAVVPCPLITESVYDNFYPKIKKRVILGKYAKFISERKDFPMSLLNDFTKKVYDGIDDYDFERDDTRPELLKIHWAKRENIKERHLELFIPIK